MFSWNYLQNLFFLLAPSKHWAVAAMASRRVRAKPSAGDMCSNANHALSESRAWWWLPQPPRQRLSWRSKNHCHSHYQSLSISTNLDSIRSIWCPILGSPLADLAAVPTLMFSCNHSSTIFGSFPKPKGPTLPHWSVFKTSTRLITETLRNPSQALRALWSWCLDMA